MPLLHVAPPWEPLHTPTRNVSVSAVLTGAIPAALQATARRPADLRLPSPSSPPPSQRLYYSGSLSEESTAHWQTPKWKALADALLLRDASALYRRLTSAASEQRGQVRRLRRCPQTAPLFMADQRDVRTRSLR